MSRTCRGRVHRTTKGSEPALDSVLWRYGTLTCRGRVVGVSWACRGHVVGVSWACRGRVVECRGRVVDVCAPHAASSLPACRPVGDGAAPASQGGGGATRHTAARAGPSGGTREHAGPHLPQGGAWQSANLPISPHISPCRHRPVQPPRALISPYLPQGGAWQSGVVGLPNHCCQVICRAVGHCQTSCHVLSVLSGAVRCLSDKRGAL